MLPGRGRAKGAKNERALSKVIVSYFAHLGITQECCYRTPGSGGHRFAKKTDGGDLVISPVFRKYFNFSVEAKDYASINWLLPMLEYREKSVLSQWWKQCVTASNAAKPYQPPLLVVKARGTPYIAFVRQIDIPSVPMLAEFAGLRPFTATKCVGEHVIMLPLDVFLRRCVMSVASNSKVTRVRQR